MLMIICTWKSQRMGTSNLKLMPHSWIWGCTTFHNFLWMWKKKKMKSWQVCDWLAKWLIMSGYMDLRRPRVYRRSNVGLVWFVFIHHNFQFYFELCTYCNILDIYLSQNLNFINYLLFYMKLLNYLFFNMFGSVLECCELTGVSLL